MIRTLTSAIRPGPLAHLRAEARADFLREAAWTLSEIAKSGKAAGLRLVGEEPEEAVVTRLAALAHKLGLALEVAPDEPAPPLRSNSFVYTRRECWPDFDYASCPIRLGEREVPNDFRRSVLLKEAEGVAHYVCQSGDFAEAERWRLTRELGQLYRDRSGEALHTDFARELGALKLHAPCRGCARFADCPALYEPSDEEPFAQAEAALHARLDRLRGVILDLGAGPLPYGDRFAALMAAGLARFDLLDPAPPDTLHDFVTAHPQGARLFACEAEAFVAPPESYDAILVLRSHNHLRAPHALYPRLYEWLKPGGTLLLADNVAYGVLRSPERFAAVRVLADARPFEHRRNDDLAHALASLDGLAFTPLHLDPVRPGGANQWVAVLRKGAFTA